MRILVHDFSGHPFQAELARSLGRRGHQVLHLHCASYQSGQGGFDDSEGCVFESIALDDTFARYDLRRRLQHEVQYGGAFVRKAKAFGPDVVLSCNDPLLAKARFGAWAAIRRVPWIFWLQDVYSVAMSREAAKRSKAGRAAGTGFRAIERRLLRSADHVVAITEDFDGVLDGWKVPRAHRTVIENWAPLAEVPVRPRANPWRVANLPDDRFTYLYSGTLGLKHNPGVLHELALAEPDALVVVISEGLGADRLHELQKEQHAPNLLLLPFQPWIDVPDVLGSADVLVVLLEKEAGSFSVPSKVLTSLCAGRPLLAAIPSENLAARTIIQAGAGIVIPPGEPTPLIDAARLLRLNPERCDADGRAAREYAELAFDIGSITDRFMAVISSVAGETEDAG